MLEFQGNLGLNFDLCRESMALESGNTEWRLHVLCAKCFFYLKTATLASLKANKAVSREKGPGATYLRRL